MQGYDPYSDIMEGGPGIPAPAPATPTAGGHGSTPYFEGDPFGGGGSTGTPGRAPPQIRPIVGGYTPRSVTRTAAYNLAVDPFEGGALTPAAESGGGWWAGIGDFIGGRLRGFNPFSIIPGGGLIPSPYRAARAVYDVAQRVAPAISPTIAPGGLNFPTAGDIARLVIGRMPAPAPALPLPFPINLVMPAAPVMPLGGGGAPAPAPVSGGDSLIDNLKQYGTGIAIGGAALMALMLLKRI